MNLQNTIVAPATPGNVSSALGIIRLSGENALEICSSVFFPKSRKIKTAADYEANHTYYGEIKREGKLIDEVVISVFLAPNSFTGENLVEISHHGSVYIQKEILNLLIDKGACLARRGEFSERAFLNAKINLSQAEAIADIIASRSSLSLDIAMQQLRGGYNEMLKTLRADFLHIASLLELEIDFSEEHEIFVDREKLEQELSDTDKLLKDLINSFEQGNAFKSGIPVAIVGKPNSGKSTLLNSLLKEERSIVSDIEGTTRDTVEETFFIDNIEYRLIDTAGIRSSKNKIEAQGIERSFKAIEKSKIILLISDIRQSLDELKKEREELIKKADCTGKVILHVLNKEDGTELSKKQREERKDFIIISALKGTGLENLSAKISQSIPQDDIADRMFMTNARHYEIMKRIAEEIFLSRENVKAGISSDLIAENIRSATSLIGEITGEICNEDVLNNIFSNFCIGK